MKRLSVVAAMLMAWCLCGPEAKAQLELPNLDPSRIRSPINPPKIEWPPFDVGPTRVNGRTPVGTIRDVRGGVDVVAKGFKSQRHAEKVRDAFWLMLTRWHRPEVVAATAEAMTRHRDNVLTRQGPPKTNPAAGKKASGTPFDETDYSGKSLDEKKQVVAFCVLGMGNFGLEPGKENLRITITGTPSSSMPTFEGQKCLGRGEEGYFGVVDASSGKTPKVPTFKIEVNRDEVENLSLDALAGVIWHEMLHNIGFDHADTDKKTTFNSAYKGYLIDEWGNAVENNGKPGAALRTVDKFYRGGPRGRRGL